MTKAGENKRRNSATSNTRQPGVVLKPYCNCNPRSLFIPEDIEDSRVVPWSENEKAG